MDNRGESRKIIFISKWKLSKEEVNFGNLKNLEIFTTNANGMELELILEDIQPDYIILTYCDFDTIRVVELYKNYKAQTSVKGFHGLSVHLMWTNSLYGHTYIYTKTHQYKISDIDYFELSLQSAFRFLLASVAHKRISYWLSPFFYFFQI